MNDKVFIVGIELNTRASIEKFEQYNFNKGIPFKIMPGLYCIKTSFSETSEIIRERIVALFSGQCQVFVMKSSIEAAWRLPSNVDGWLKSNI